MIKNGEKINKVLTNSGAVKVVERSKSFEDIEHPKKKLGYGMLYVALLVLVVTLIIGMIAYQYECKGSVFCMIGERYLNIFKASRSMIYKSLLGLALIQGGLALFWKPARKIGLFVFYFVAAAVTAVFDQIVDYITRSDMGQRYENAKGASFGDYGIVFECGYGGYGYSKETTFKKEEIRNPQIRAQIQKVEDNLKVKEIKISEYGSDKRDYNNKMEETPLEVEENLENKNCRTQTDCGGDGSGYFCNSFGNHTPNRCEKTNPETITRNGQTYYYNNLYDLRSWCREAYESREDRDNPGNCNWGYLSYQSANGWCASIGKQLLYANEIRQNCEQFDFLPIANPDQQYWTEGVTVVHMGQNCSIQEMVRGDGYAWAGGVVCK